MKTEHWPLNLAMEGLFGDFWQINFRGINELKAGFKCSKKE